MNRHHHHWCANAWVGAPWACGDHHQHHSKENYDCSGLKKVDKCNKYKDNKDKCNKHYTKQKRKPKKGKEGGSYPCVFSKVTETNTGLPASGTTGHCGIDLNNKCS